MIPLVRQKCSIKIEKDNWVSLKEPTYVGNESLVQFENLNIKAKAVRMIATEDRDDTWFASSRRLQ